jgi:hypothetical protein
VIVPDDVTARIEAATRAFAEAAPWQPSSAPHAPAAAAAIEAALIAGEPRRALEAAESALAAAIEDRAAHVWLAWGLGAVRERPSRRRARSAPPRWRRGRQRRGQRCRARAAGLRRGARGALAARLAVKARPAPRRARPVRRDRAADRGPPRRRQDRAPPASDKAKRSKSLRVLS